MYRRLCKKVSPNVATTNSNTVRNTNQVMIRASRSPERESQCLRAELSCIMRAYHTSYTPHANEMSSNLYQNIGFASRTEPLWSNAFCLAFISCQWTGCQLAQNILCMIYGSTKIYRRENNNLKSFLLKVDINVSQYGHQNMRRILCST